MLVHFRNAAFSTRASVSLGVSTSVLKKLSNTQFAHYVRHSNMYMTHTGHTGLASSKPKRAPWLYMATDESNVSLLLPTCACIL